MRKFKLAFVTTMITDSVPLISAIKSITQKFGDIIALQLKLV